MSKHFLIALALGAAATLASAQSEAAEFEKNAIRFVGSAAVAAGATYALQDTEHPALYGAAIGAIPSVVKELSDTRTKHGAQGGDLVIGFAGAAVGAYVAGEALEARDLAPVAVSALAGPVAGTLTGAVMSEEPLTREDAPGLLLSVAAAAAGGWPVMLAQAAWSLASE